jgi:SAM-dependent methyltransferase
MDILDYRRQKRSEHLHFWYKARKELIAGRLQREFGGFSSDRLIFDIGCGCGAELDDLKKFGKVSGLEINPEAAQVAREQGVDVVVGDIGEVVLPENKYDVVAALDVLEHIKDDEGALKKINQTLKPGGMILINVPAFQFLFGPHDRALQHYRRYDRQILIDRLAAAGFVNIKTAYWNSFFFLPAFLWRIANRFFSSPNRSSQDFTVPPPLVNEMFYIIMKVENFFYFHNIRLPFGISLTACGKKKI